MNSREIRQRFLKFFESKGHSVIPSASLVPVGDASVLFTTAGMQPLVPYLLGAPHPSGTRLASAQKCVRTGDIDDIGDNRHLTFFEMLGNWSLGDPSVTDVSGRAGYFKDESIAWSYEFLTDKEHGLGLDPARLYVTCFEGDESAPRDDESKELWMKAGIPEHRIYFLGKDDNWWSPGDNGPCGPDTEIFYDMDGALGDLSPEEFNDAVKTERAIEIWNNVFMEYEARDGRVIGKLAKKNVDTGMGLERITAVVNGKTSVYDTDFFERPMQLLGDYSKHLDQKAARVICDHVRAATFLVSDGVLPGKEKASYVLRRLIRKAVRNSWFIDEITADALFLILIDLYVDFYKDVYLDLKEKEQQIKSVIIDEAREVIKLDSTANAVIQKAIDSALEPYPPMRAYNNMPPRQEIPDYQIAKTVPPQVLFNLITTKGIDPDMLLAYVNNKGHIFFDRSELDKLLEDHKKLSRSASAGMFKGGLANHNERTIRLHTAHHLLLAALQQVLGPEVKQRGSNITEERLRIDFSFDRKMTDEEKQKVEALVNDAIARDLKVVRREMTKDEAEKIGAQMEFGAKYGDTVSVYFIEDENGNAFSKEFCGGPHVEHVGNLGHFKIQKEEASSQGVRRIKGVLE